MNTTFGLSQAARRPSNIALRHISPSIALKRTFLAVDLTVSSLCAYENSNGFPGLHVQETFEWEWLQSGLDRAGHPPISAAADPS